MEYSDSFIKEVLDGAATIALVGASMKPERASHQVGLFLAQTGRRVIPVNPGLAGQHLFGERVVADLADIQEPVDMVDIFRRSEHVPAIVDTALAAFPSLGSIWMQIGVVHEAAARLAEGRGVSVVMNRCPKIEMLRLSVQT